MCQNENYDLALRDFSFLLDKDRSALSQLLYNMLVVNDLLAHIDRRAVLIERLLYGLDCTIHTGAVPARCREDDLFDTCRSSPSHN